MLLVKVVVSAVVEGEREGEGRGGGGGGRERRGGGGGREGGEGDASTFVCTQHCRIMTIPMLHCGPLLPSPHWSVLHGVCVSLVDQVIFAACHTAFCSGKC